MRLNRNKTFAPKFRGTAAETINSSQSKRMFDQSEVAFGDAAHVISIKQHLDKINQNNEENKKADRNNNDYLTSEPQLSSNNFQHLNSGAVFSKLDHNNQQQQRYN